eukprot:356379-Chlamydomonas_euryale.AAC.9
MYAWPSASPPRAAKPPPPPIAVHWISGNGRVAVRADWRGAVSGVVRACRACGRRAIAGGAEGAAAAMGRKAAVGAERGGTRVVPLATCRSVEAAIVAERRAVGSGRLLRHRQLGSAVAALASMQRERHALEVAGALSTVAAEHGAAVAVCCVSVEGSEQKDGGRPAPPAAPGARGEARAGCYRR